MKLTNRFSWRWIAAAVVLALILIPVGHGGRTRRPDGQTTPRSLSIASPADGAVLGGNVVQMMIDAITTWL